MLFRRRPAFCACLVGLLIVYHAGICAVAAHASFIPSSALSAAHPRSLSCPRSTPRPWHSGHVAHRHARARGAAPRATAAPALDSINTTHPAAAATAGAEDVGVGGNQARDDPFALLSGLGATALLASDRRIPEGAATGGVANWVDPASSFALQTALDKVALRAPGEEDAAGGEARDEAVAWLRWLRSVPRPVVVDLSDEMRRVANDTVSDDSLATLDAAGGGDVPDDIKDNVGNGGGEGGATAGDVAATAARDPAAASKVRQLRTAFLDRLGCRLILLPSGQPLRGGLYEPPGSLTFGKLLYGGVARYRLVPSSARGGVNGRPQPPRRAGERTARKASAAENVPSWLQYGECSSECGLPSLYLGEEAAANTNTTEIEAAIVSAKTSVCKTPGFD